MDENYKRKMIATTAAAYFYKMGITTVSMDDIARGCSVSKRTIYTFFGNKRELIQEILTNNLDEFILELERIKKESLDAVSELFCFFDFLGNSYSKLSFSFLNDLKKMNTETTDVQTLIERFLSENIKRGEKEGIYKQFKSSDNPVELFSRILKNLFSEQHIHSADIKTVAELFSLYLVSHKEI